MTDARNMEIHLTMDGARRESESYHIPLKEMESLNNACVLR